MRKLVVCSHLPVRHREAPGVGQDDRRGPSERGPRAGLQQASVHADLPRVAGGCLPGESLRAAGCWAPAELPPQPPTFREDPGRPLQGRWSPPNARPPSRLQQAFRWRGGRERAGEALVRSTASRESSQSQFQFRPASGLTQQARQPLLPKSAGDREAGPWPVRSAAFPLQLSWGPTSRTPVFTSAEFHSQLCSLAVSPFSFSGAFIQLSYFFIVISMGKMFYFQLTTELYS